MAFYNSPYIFELCCVFAVNSDLISARSFWYFRSYSLETFISDSNVVAYYRFKSILV
jgi:hypothetical protein